METTGCGTAIITPFRADGSIDESALWELVNWQIESGIDFLVACGSTGEAATLDEVEWLSVVRIVVEAAAARVPVWAGCTHNSTRTLVRRAALLRRVHGVAAVLSANP
jgi:4-hydroxy-tetrahydrodipicolinate synthase